MVNVPQRLERFAMYVQVEEKPDVFLYDTPLVHQSFFWSQIKQNQGFGTRSFDIKVRRDAIEGGDSSAYVLDDILLLTIPVNRESSIAYAPYGPLITPNEQAMGPFLEELSEALRDKLDPHTLLVRYDLPWQRPWDGDVVDPRLWEIRMNWDTAGKRIRKSVADQLPSDTMVVDLSGSEDEILSRMHPKTRYNIRLAERHGVEVRKGGLDDLTVFYRLYQETAHRNGITLHDISFFRSFFGPKDDDAGFTLLVASLDGNPLSAMFLTYSDRRATYLFGASSDTHRESMSTYALQWEAMKLARNFGCRSYDLFGVAPDDNPEHPMHGLYRFKRGFGGQMIHRLGCWEYPYDEEAVRELAAYEMVDKGYHQR
jgi:lipid II:glycine glycyltransferase (peptidoglycan interpeptide bridge formation enzyme)